MTQAAGQQQQMKEVIDAKGAQDVSVGPDAGPTSPFSPGGSGARGRALRRARTSSSKSPLLLCALSLQLLEENVVHFSTLLAPDGTHPQEKLVACVRRAGARGRAAQGV